jgi:hypothetical protein
MEPESSLPYSQILQKLFVLGILLSVIFLHK